MADRPQLSSTKSMSCLSSCALSDDDTAYISDVGSSLSTISHQGALPFAQSVVFGERSLSMDCHLCNISLQPSVHGIEGIAHVVITFQKVKVATQYHVKPLMLALEHMLRCLERTHTNFVISYDFRVKSMPMPEIANVFSKIHCAPRRLKAIALLVPDNLFIVPVKSWLRNFMTESCLPSCPHLIAHDETIAAEFFRVLVCQSCPAGAESFVSLEGVSDSAGRPGNFEACIAKLMPFLRPQDDEVRFEIATNVPHMSPMMHTLANGDVRVIQTAASDVMLRQTTPGDLQLDMESADVDPPEGNAREKKSSSGDLHAHLVKALKFQCSAEKLKALTGTVFHLGELTIDADATSAIQKGRQSKVRAHRREAALRSNDFTAEIRHACFEGVMELHGLLKPLTSCFTQGLRK